MTDSVGRIGGDHGAWWSTDAAVDDDRRVVIGPVAPGDKRRLAALLARQGPAAGAYRFHCNRSTYVARELADLTEVDYVDHFVWVATAVDVTGQPIVGLARYVRDVTDRRSAQCTICVAEEWRGVGLERTLLGFLAVAAEENGVTRLQSETGRTLHPAA